VRVAPPATPLERLEAFADPGSLRLLRTEVESTRLGARSRPGDGVLTASATLAGEPVHCFAQDLSFLGGSLGEAHADSIVNTLRLAERAGTPVVGFIESAGARMQEGLAALAGYGRIFREHVRLSGVIPQLSVVSGPAAGGSSYGPALGDFVVMTHEAAMFLTGPGVVGKVTGEQVDMESLGGCGVHARNGVSHFTAEDDLAAIATAQRLLEFLPRSAGAAQRVLGRWREPERAIEDLVPANPRKVYEVRSVIEALADADSVLEVSPLWAPNIVCAFARIEGRPVGVIASQPRRLAGVLDVDSSQKAARMVDRCDAFGLPLVVLVDTPGFMPGTAQEGGGAIRHGATLVRAFAAATVPSVTVVTRKAFGGAYIAMNSKPLGADHAYAWRGATLGVMGAEQAVEITGRRRLEAAEDADALRRELVDEYSEHHLTAGTAAAGGFVDAVIDPAETRDRIARAFASFAGAA
jgi:acetyl-CoA carboxylase carboxyltransferase component